MLQTQELRFSYPGGREFQYPDLRCAAGASLLITGQSGCGKTTLLHMLAGILRPASGTVQIDDTRLSQLPDSACDRFRGQHIGLVYQRPHFLAALSVLENLLLPPFFGGVSWNKQGVVELAEKLGIGHTLHQKPARLSVGEQQRASIARALVNRPRLLLADEPTSALDDENCDIVIRLLREHAHACDAALVIVTHDNRLKSLFPDQIALSRINA